MSRYSTIIAPFTVALIIVGGNIASVAVANQDDEISSNDTVQIADLDEKTASIAKALTGIAVEGWKAAPIERYVVANLYDKINGRSELYMSYDVKSMVFRSFANAADSSQYIDVFLYDMGSTPGAFGVFSVERWGDWEALDLGREAYRKETDIFFWKGPYYATILGSGNEPEVRDAQFAIARELHSKLKDRGDTLWGLEVLPKEALAEGSVQYFMVDALSLGFLTNTYTAEYSYEGAQISVFVSRQASESEAKDTYDRYVEYMKRYGEEVKTVETGNGTVVLANMGGGYCDAVFAWGAYVAGVTAVPDRTTALKAAQKLHEHLGVLRKRRN